MTAQLERKLRTSRILNLVLVIALVFVGGSYAALLWGSSNNGGATPPSAAEITDNTGATQDATDQTNPTPQAQPAPANLNAEPYMTIGSPDAPVVLYEWTDFTCPYCGLFHRDTLPSIITDYVDTGKVRIEIHDVTFIGPQAEDAAVAARAAGQQDRYADYMFGVYALGADGARPDLGRDTLFGVAEQLGLDMKRFESDFADPDLRAKVQASTALAQAIGINSVPYFVAAPSGSLEGAQEVKGAQPLENFKVFLDAYIAETTAKTGE